MTEELKVMEKKALTIQTQAHILKITDQETLTKANDGLLTIKVMLQEVNRTFKPMKDKARESVREIQEKWDKHAKPLKDAEKTYKDGIAAYYREQEKIRLEAEKEQLRIAREFEEKERLEREKLEKEKREKAEAAIKAGDLDAYQKIVDKPTPEPEVEPSPEPFNPPPAAPALAKGTSIRKNWKYEIIDPSKIPVEYMKIDEVKIGQYVRVMKEKAAIPGVKVWSEDVISARTNQ